MIVILPDVWLFCEILFFASLDCYFGVKLVYVTHKAIKEW